MHIRGSLAVVWTPDQFWIDGKTSHCGIDAFEMVKEKGIWRIGHMMWTVEPDACAALRPTDPARIRPRQVPGISTNRTLSTSPAAAWTSIPRTS